MLLNKNTTWIKDLEYNVKDLNLNKLDSKIYHEQIADILDSNDQLNKRLTYDEIEF